MTHIIYRDGTFEEAGAEVLESLTPGVLKARGAFETMRVCKGSVPLWADHWARLNKGLKHCSIPLTCTASKLKCVIRELVKENSLKEDARVRLEVWKDSSGLHSAVVAQPCSSLAQGQIKDGWRLKSVCVSALRPLVYPHLKPLEYQVFRQAHLTAVQGGFDDALIINAENHVTEASRANLFWIKENNLCTPPLASGCLAGVMRKRVLHCAKKMKLQVHTKRASLQEVCEAKEVFVTNALMGVMPVGTIDEQSISGNAVTAQLLQKMILPLFIKIV